MPIGVSQFPQVVAHGAGWNWTIANSIVGEDSLLALASVSSNILSVDYLNSEFRTDEACPAHCLWGFLFNRSAIANVQVHYEARFPTLGNVFRDVVVAPTITPGNSLNELGALSGVFLPPFPEFRIRIENLDAVETATFEGCFTIRTSRT